MNRSGLLAVASIVALAAGGAAMAAQAPSMVFKTAKVASVVHHSKGAKVLYNQNSNSDGLNINSQNYTSGTYTAYNDEGADDFIVPKGKTWTVTEVDVTGCCSGSGGTENVYFYKDKGGVPGKLVKHGSFTNLNATGNPNYQISLGKKGMKLKAGHYWVGVNVNCDYGGSCVEWGWTMTATVHNDASVWQQPGNGAGTGCTSWNALNNCFGDGYTGDFLFELQGQSGK
jgi:hypothetical protein